MHAESPCGSGTRPDSASEDESRRARNLGDQASAAGERSLSPSRNPVVAAPSGVPPQTGTRSGVFVPVGRSVRVVRDSLLIPSTGIRGGGGHSGKIRWEFRSDI